MFDEVDACDWLHPSGLERLFADVVFLDDRGLGKVKPLTVGPRRPSRDLTSTWPSTNRAAVETAVDVLAGRILELMLEGLSSVARRYHLQRFPVEQLGR